MDGKADRGDFEMIRYMIDVRIEMDGWMDGWRDGYERINE